jgi:hypothetical protein
MPDARSLERVALMATTYPTDAKAVARFLAQGCGCDKRAQGCGCSSGERPRAQGLINTPGDYRTYARQLKTTADQLDTLASKDPQWQVFKASVDALYEDYKDVGWSDSFRLSQTTWERLDDANRALQGWGEKLRKELGEKAVGPLALTAPKSLAEDFSDAAKAASGFIGGDKSGSLADRILPTFSTGTKVVAGLVAGGYVLSKLGAFAESGSADPAQPRGVFTRAASKVVELLPFRIEPKKRG